MNDVGVRSGRERNLARQVEELRVVERMEDNPDGVCRAAHRPDLCPHCGRESDACCRPA